MIKATRLPLIMAVAVATLSACSSDGDDRYATPCVGAELSSERLFLQQLTDTSVIVKWRGDADAACLGTDQSLLNMYANATATEGDHKEATFTGLAPETLYYYSVGGAITAPGGQQFRTSPASGALPSDGNTRIWIIGDSGTGGDDEREEHEGEAIEVLQGMESYVAQDGEAVDVFLMLGDNAYDIGSDYNYQQAVFEVYPELLKQVSVWPVIGNHEMGIGLLNGVVPYAGFSQSSDPDSWIDDKDAEPRTAPHLDIFSMPTGGEAGGVASGTEQYYSFDYGNVHIVGLDSQVAARDEGQRNSMREWLIDDLSGNTSDWTVVMFHHPPYSKGANHDSDDTEKFGGFDMPQRDMREEFGPVFDEYGVDLVYNGHSHSYERSYYITNHTGASDSFSTAEHAELVGGDPEHPASGRGDEAYAQLSPTSGGVDNRVVYTVNGASGKADTESGLTDPEVFLLHPAHIEQPNDIVEPARRGIPKLGSVLVDANDSNLVARYIGVNGEVLDEFTITR